MARVQIELTTTGAAEAERILRNVAKASDGIGDSLKRVFEIATGVNLANVFESAVRGVVRTTQELVKLGLETQRQEQAFAKMTASLGVNGQALEAALERASRGIADISDVMTKAAVGLQEGLQPQQLVSLMEIATSQSQLMGTTVAEAFNQITTAVLSQQERGLKTAGIYLDLTTVFAEYAAKLGVTTDRLTEYAKTQAIVAAVEEQTRVSRKALTAETLTNDQAVQKLATSYQNVREAAATSMVEMAAAAGRNIPVMVGYVERAAEAMANLRRRIEGVAAALPLVGEAVSRAAKLRDLGDLVAAGEAGPGATNLAMLGRLGAPTPALIKPPDAAEMKRAAADTQRLAEALADFRQKLVDLAIADQTAKQLMGVRLEVEKLAKADPSRGAVFTAIGMAMEGVIVAGAQAKKTLEELEAAWKEATDVMNPAAERAALAIGSFDAAVSTTGDLGQAYRRTLGDIRFGLEGVGGATVDIVDVQSQAKESTEDLTAVYAQFGPTINAQQRATQDFADTMASIAIQSRVLGADFDVLSARVAATQTNWNAAVTAFAEGRITLDELTAAGGRFQTALADERVYKGIEASFLSITATATKMVDAVIAGTFKWKDAWTGLLNFALNFAQTLLHEVIDPLLKDLARLTAGFLGFGQSGSGSLATAGGLIGGVIGAAGGGGSTAAAVGEGAYALASSAAATGGSGGGDTLGTLSSVASGLSAVYSAVAYVTGLPTLLDLTALGLTAVGEALGIIGPAAAAAEAGFAAASSAAATGGAAAAEASAAATAGVAGAIWPVAFAALPALIVGVGTLLQSESRANARWRRFHEERQGAAMTADVGASLSGLTLENAVQGARRSHLETLAAFAQFSALTPERLEQQRLAGTLAQTDIPGSQYTQEGQPPKLSDVLPFEQSAVLKEAHSLVDNLTKLGIEASYQWGQSSEELGAISNLFLNMPHWNTLLVAFANAFEALMGGIDDAAAETFDRAALIRDLLAEPTQIALLLDLPSLAREGEDTAETFRRMVTALSGLDDMMQELNVTTAGLRGELDVPGLLATNLARVTEAMDAANIALATTQDPEKMLAAAQELNQLIELRYQLEIDAVNQLTTMLRSQMAGMGAGLTALAQAAPVLRSLGIEVGGMTDALADVIDVLGDVGDAAGQLETLGQVAAAFSAEVSGASPDQVLASTRALAQGLSATTATVNALADAQQRVAGLSQILGTLTAGYEAATAALTAHFAALRAQEEKLFADRVQTLESEIEHAVGLVRAYYGAQREALTDLLAASRQWEAVASRIRDQVRGLQLGPTSPLNPAESLRLVQEQFAAAQVSFAAKPTAAGAETVAGLGGQVIEAASQVFSRPSPAFQALFTDVTAALAGVAATAEARVTPEEDIVRLLTAIDKTEALALGKLGVIDTSTAAALKELGFINTDIDLSEAAIAKLAKSGLLTEETFNAVFQAAGASPTPEAAEGAQNALASLIAGELSTAIEPTTGAVDKTTEAAYAVWLAVQDVAGKLAGVQTAGEASKTSLDALKVEHAAKLDAIAAAEAEWGAALWYSLGNVAAQVVGTTTAVYAGTDASWATAVAVGGLWGAIGALQNEITRTHNELVKVLGPETTLAEFETALNKNLHDNLWLLGQSIHDSLTTLVGNRIDALLTQGGPQAVVDALNRNMDDVVLAVDLSRIRLDQQLERIISQGNKTAVPRIEIPGAQGGARYTHEGLYYLHRGERVLNPEDAEMSRRLGGGSAGAPTINIVIHEAKDAHDTARQIRRALDDYDRKWRDRGRA